MLDNSIAIDQLEDEFFVMIGPEYLLSELVPVGIAKTKQTACLQAAKRLRELANEAERMAYE